MNRKIILLCVAALVLSVSCKKQEPAAPPPPIATETTAPAPEAPLNPNQTADPNVKPTTIEFSEEVHDFGTIKQGDKPSHYFTFKNTGDNDLIINRAQGSCGCTVPEFPKEAIAPGKTEKMKVTFNSAGKSGKVEKTVTVFANIPDGVKVIKIKANILVK